MKYIWRFLFMCSFIYLKIVLKFHPVEYILTCTDYFPVLTTEEILKTKY